MKQVRTPSNSEYRDRPSDGPEHDLEWLEADPHQFGELEDDQSSSGNDGQLSVMCPLTALTLCGDHESTTDQGSEQ